MTPAEKRAVWTSAITRIEPNAVAVRGHNIADLMGHGVFMQEPSACTFCDFKSVCGPNPVLESRKRRRRLHDPLARKVAELKQFA